MTTREFSNPIHFLLSLMLTSACCLSLGCGSETKSEVANQDEVQAYLEAHPELKADPTVEKDSPSPNAGI